MMNGRNEANLPSRTERGAHDGGAVLADLVTGLSGVRSTHAARVADVCWGGREISQRIDALVGAASTEVAAMCTPNAGLFEAIVRTPRADGMCTRLAVAADDAASAARRQLWHALAGDGVLLRLGEVPTSALIIDTATVALPICDADGTRTAGLAILRLPSAVIAVVELFERVWSVSAPLAGTAEARQSGLTRREQDLLELMFAGTTDESAANRLGVSVRTVRRMVSDLMNRLGARSRFEAGARAAERGWLPALAARR